LWLEEMLEDLRGCNDLQGEPSGRLLSYNPATRKTHVVAQGFWFANGVALSKDESFIAVVETNTQTVHRVWLTGAKVLPSCYFPEHGSSGALPVLR